MNHEENLTYDWLRTLRENASVTKRASETRPAAAKAFGDFEYTVDSSGNITIVNNPPPLGKATLKCQTTGESYTVDFHKNHIAQLEKAYLEGSAKGYCPGSSGTYNPRVVNNSRYSNLPVESRPLSNHSFGTAIDFDADKNPFKAGNVSEMERHPEFVQAFLNNGFNWLGDGLGLSGRGHIGDDMHFDVRYEGDYSGAEQASVASAETEGGSMGGADWAVPFRSWLDTVASKGSKVQAENKKKLKKKVILEFLSDVSVNAAEAIRNRAIIAFKSNNWTYSRTIGSSKPDPKTILPGMPASSDCTGFVTWCWGADPSKRMSDVSTRVTNPEVGAAFWYPPQPGHEYGHGGIIIAINGDEFETLDCGESKNGIRYVKNGKSFWSKPANGYQNLEFWKSSTTPPNPGNPEYFAGQQQNLDSESGSDWSVPFRSWLNTIASKNLSLPIQKEAAYLWKDYKQALKESSSNCLSDDQIAKLLYDVGFRDEDLVTAVRIVIGESGGCPNATNVNRGAKGKYKDSVDRGIFQFNNVAFPNFSDADAFDPIKNAQYAFRVYKKVGFRPWKGKTQFHTLKHKDLTPDTNKIERAKNAVAKLTGYVSTGNFEYLQNPEGNTSQPEGSDWSVPFRTWLDSLTTKKSINESKVKIGKKFIVVNKSKNKDIEKNKKILFSMLKYYDDKLQFDLPVKIIFKDDRDNSQKPLGKTGYYHPEETSIIIFTTNRLLKDILRSLGHELIHHKQHCIHPFENHKTEAGYAQKDKRMRRKEKEAYLFGNMLFRDFEDNYKTKHKGVF